MKKVVLVPALFAAASAGCGRNENKLPFKALPNNAPNVEQHLVMKETLLNMHITHEGRTILRHLRVRRFIKTKDDDYLPVLKYAETIHLNFSAYDYIND